MQDETTAALIQEVRTAETPGGRSLAVSVFASRALREKEISLYEAYLLQGMSLEFLRLSYLLPAWSGRVQISTLLQLMNMRFLAALYGEKETERHWIAYGREALSRNRERRPHYILDHFPDYLEDPVPPERLQELQNVRSSRKKPFDRGPYHTDVFPYNKCKYEELLLLGKALRHKKACPEIERLVAELMLILETS